MTAAIPGTSLEVLTAARAAAVLSGWYRTVWAAVVVAVVVALVVGLLAAALHRAIDEARRAQVRAEAGERAKARFLATMSHEIRTPMTAVLGMLDLLREPSLPPDARDKVAMIRGAGEQLLAIINDILDFMRLEGDALTLADVDFDLDAAIDAVHSVMGPQATLRGLGFEVDSSGAAGSLWLKGDPRRLKQVLFNLVGNAVKFTPEGRITLRARRLRAPDDGPVLIRIEVQDTGMGFDADEASGLFDAFAQTERSTQAAIGGTGLGLAISKHLVERMGGTIGCTGVPDVGSLFWFEIPFERGCPREAKAAAETTAAARPLKVLVAEDAPLNQELIVELLRRMGHTATMTGDGRAFLAAAAAEPFDVLVADIGMPILDGETAIVRLRDGAGPNRTAPAIALTANVIESDQARYLRKGFDACLHKPIDRQALCRAIERLTADRSPPPDVPAIAPPVDRAALSRITEGVPPEKVAEWLERALQQADATLARLEERVDPTETVRLAHRLRGTCANLGLCAVSEAAAAIECADRAASPASLRALRDAIARTRAARRSGVSHRCGA